MREAMMRNKIIVGKKRWSYVGVQEGKIIGNLVKAKYVCIIMVCVTYKREEDMYRLLGNNCLLNLNIDGK